MLQRIARELLSGVAVAIVALPLAIAFGITATGTSQGALIGLYGAIFAGFFAAVFGGTPGQVTGPTGPISYPRGVLASCNTCLWCRDPGWLGLLKSWESGTAAVSFPV